MPVDRPLRRSRAARRCLSSIAQDGAERSTIGAATRHAGAADVDAPADARPVASAARACSACPSPASTRGLARCCRKSASTLPARAGRVARAAVHPQGPHGRRLRWHEVRGRMGPFLQERRRGATPSDAGVGGGVGDDGVAAARAGAAAQPWPRAARRTRARGALSCIKAAARSALARPRAPASSSLRLYFQGGGSSARVATLMIILLRRPTRSLRRAADDVARRRDEALASSAAGSRPQARARRRRRHRRAECLRRTRSRRAAGSVAAGSAGRVWRRAVHALGGRARHFAPMSAHATSASPPASRCGGVPRRPPAIVHLEAESDWEKAIDASERASTSASAADERLWPPRPRGGVRRAAPSASGELGRLAAAPHRVASKARACRPDDSEARGMLRRVLHRA